MAGSEALPIYKSALSLAIYMEQIVRGFEKYHKYTIGVDRRSGCPLPDMCLRAIDAS